MLSINCTNAIRKLPHFFIFSSYFTPIFFIYSPAIASIITSQTSGTILEIDEGLNRYWYRRLLWVSPVAKNLKVTSQFFSSWYWFSKPRCLLFYFCTNFFQQELKKQKLKTNFLRKFEYVNFVCNYTNFKVFTLSKSLRFHTIVTYARDWALRLQEIHNSSV